MLMVVNDLDNGWFIDIIACFQNDCSLALCFGAQSLVLTGITIIPIHVKFRFLARIQDVMPFRLFGRTTGRIKHPQLIDVHRFELCRDAMFAFHGRQVYLSNIGLWTPVMVQ